MAKSNIARRLGAFYGIEDGDETTNTEVGEQPIADEVSAPVADVAEAAAEVAEEEEALADLTTDAEQTEDLQGAVEVATNYAEEAMSAESAAWVRLALHQITGKYGITSDVMPSLEAFGGTSGRRAATRATLEGISDFLKKIWNAIKAQIQKVWAYMKNWYLKVLDAAPRLKKKAEAVSKRSENLTGSPESKDVSGSLKQLHIAGKAPSGGDLAAKFKLISEQTKASLGDKTAGSYEKLFEKYENQINEMANDDLKNFGAGRSNKTADISRESIGSYVMSLEVNANDRLAAAGDEISRLNGLNAEQKKKLDELAAFQAKVLAEQEALKAASRAAPGQFGDEASGEASPELPGGKAVWTISPKDKENAEFKVRVRNTYMKFTDFLQKPKEVDSTGDFKTFSSSDIQSICDSIMEICDHIIDYKKAWEKRDKYTAKMKSAVDKAINNADKEKPGDGEEAAVKLKRSLITELAKGLQKVWSSGSSFESALINYGISVSRAALSVCEASIAQYKD